MMSRRLWFGLKPELRESRFHTQKGQYALGSPGMLADCAAACATGLARKVAGIRPLLPWITFPAMRFIRARITPNTRVFEWSCGMSTLWFERRCGEVIAVEDDPAWWSASAGRAKKAEVVLLKGGAYVEKILELPAGYFDVVSVDGSHRLECFRLALRHTCRGGLLVVDNTDNDRTTKGDLFVIDQMLDELGPDWEVHRFPGWAPGNFCACETTVCVRR
jgi:hypothetical protein